jgi:excisionase family DNA binding protein
MDTPLPPQIAVSLLPMFTAEEVAALINATVWVVNKMARRGKLPGAKKVGRHWMFQRYAIQRFVEGKPV